MSDIEDTEAIEHKLKFVVVGDGAAGKTSLISRYVQGQFGKEYDQTIGLDFYQKRIEFSNGVNATLQIWDIGGQTLGGKMLDKYIYGANAVLFVYDITNSQSFTNVADWLMLVKEVVNSKESHFALVGNKGDLEHIRTVTKSQHQDYASENDMTAHIVSAKTGDSVDLCFKRIAADFLKIKLTRSDLDTSHMVIKAEVQSLPEPSTVLVKNKKRKTKSSICAVQ